MDKFTSVVKEEMEKLFPLKLAASWDNVGLLVENKDAYGWQRVLLAVDVTPEVVEEAIERKVSIIVAYHPIIFSGLKSLTLKDPKQALLLRLVQHNIAVYCPHTAIDAAAEGMNTWLANKVARACADLKVQTGPLVVLERVPGNSEPDVGFGRSIRLSNAVSPWALIRGFAQQMGGMRHVLVAPPCSLPSYGNNEQRGVQQIAVSPGSGSDLAQLADHHGRPFSESVDMYITGEMKHHEALALTSRGVWVVCLLHSNSERLFLAEHLCERLQAAMDKAGHSEAAVLISKKDRDPFVMWDVTGPEPKFGDAS